MSFAWYFNPNLSPADIAKLEEDQARSRSDLLDRLSESARRVEKEHGRTAALNHAADLLPLVFLPLDQAIAHAFRLTQKRR